MSSGPMTAWIVVSAEPNYEGNRIELLEVDAERIPASKRHWSDHERFVEHWNNGPDECFWDVQEMPAPGEYLVKFHIDSSFDYYGEYDEELVVDSLEPADLGGLKMAEENARLFGLDKETEGNDAVNTPFHTLMDALADHEAEACDSGAPLDAEDIAAADQARVTLTAAVAQFKERIPMVQIVEDETNLGTLRIEVEPILDWPGLEAFPELMTKFCNAYLYLPCSTKAKHDLLALVKSFFMDLVSKGYLFRIPRPGLADWKYSNKERDDE